MMNYNNFIELTDQETPPDELNGIHLAIWYIIDKEKNIIKNTKHNL